MQKKGVKILVIAGPTASGKSALGVRLAKKFNGEIISADSRQVYRDLDIGSGKITTKEMSNIKHHLLSVASPKRRFTVSHFQKLGRRAIKEILAKGKLPIIVGGTGFYIDSLLYETRLPEVKPNMKIRNKFEKLTADKLFKKLIKLDPERAANIDPKNKRRLIRALEIVLSTGKPVPRLGNTKSPYSILKIGLKLYDNELKKRIHHRLLARLKQGMITEVEKLRNSSGKKGISWKRLDDLGLEYRWISRYLRGLIFEKDMISKLEKEIWHYAKRQITWFKRDKKIHWISTTKEAELLTKNFLLKHEN